MTTLADLKGRTIATIGFGSVDMSIINEPMKTVGMSYDDIKQASLPLPRHLVAPQNKGIEVTLTPEPFATLIVDKGLGVRDRTTCLVSAGTVTFNYFLPARLRLRKTTPQGGPL